MSRVAFKKDHLISLTNSSCKFCPAHKDKIAVIRNLYNDKLVIHDYEFGKNPVNFDVNTPILKITRFPLAFYIKAENYRPDYIPVNNDCFGATKDATDTFGNGPPFTSNLNVIEWVASKLTEPKVISSNNNQISDLKRYKGYDEPTCFSIIRITR